MYKIGVIGPRESILCYISAGFQIYEAYDSESGAAALRQAINDNTAIIFITSEIYELILESIEKLSREMLPAVITLPSPHSSKDSSRLKKAVERAVGTDIILKGN